MDLFHRCTCVPENKEDTNEAGKDNGQGVPLTKHSRCLVPGDLSQFLRVGEGQGFCR